LILEVDEKELTEHIKKVCKNNIRRGCKICLSCPFRKYAIEKIK